MLQALIGNNACKYEQLGVAFLAICNEIGMSLPLEENVCCTGSTSFRKRCMNHKSPWSRYTHKDTNECPVQFHAL